MAAGRPSVYSEELADEICERIADGESLRSVCRDDDMPAKTTVFRWLATNDRFQDHYIKAKQAYAEGMADEMLDIADDGTNDWMEKHSDEGENIGWRENGEAIRRSALRIDTRKWVAARLLPKKYGDKVQTEHTGANGGAIEIVETQNISSGLAKALELLKAKQ